jgi:hypothetical protein
VIESQEMSVSDLPDQATPAPAGRDRPPPELLIAVTDAAARIVAGPHSSHLIQDPDIAQSVAASFRTVFDAILGAVTGAPPVPPSEAGGDTPEQSA